MKIIGKQTFKQVIAMLVVVVLASQPLAAIAELHLFYQSGSEHSSFDFLPNNSSPSKHPHTRHQLAGVKIAVELITIKSEVVLDEAAVALAVNTVDTVETVDTSATPEGESCGHTHNLQRTPGICCTRYFAGLKATEPAFLSFSPVLRA
ncbi:MAG: hypothetical protein KBT63_04530 [Porticoccaceae bacterium]|nr:hypothetical protein [Porticoccaceae bacterium]